MILFITFLNKFWQICTVLCPSPNSYIIPRNSRETRTEWEKGRLKKIKRWWVQKTIQKREDKKNKRKLSYLRKFYSRQFDIYFSFFCYFSFHRLAFVTPVGFKFCYPFLYDLLQDRKRKSCSLFSLCILWKGLACRFATKLLGHTCF